jgi:DNA repair protein RecN (Recombination protein N)
MLKHLEIRNYALISELSADLGPGMTTVTGETGAGKSIILGALSLLLGNRADSNVVLDRSHKCIVEGTFTVDVEQLKDFFQSNEIDAFSDTIIRREITTEGRSRAFINDTPVRLTTLKEFTGSLIEVHSQHQNLTIRDSEFRLNVIDAYHGDSRLLNDYSEKYQDFRDLTLQVEKLKEEQASLKRDEDYYSFLFREFENIDLEKTDQGSLESELKVLDNTDDILRSLSGVKTLIDDSEHGINTRLTSVLSTLSSIAKHHTDLEELEKRVRSVYVEMEDVSETIDGLESEFSSDPEREQQIKEILDVLYGLMQKHQVRSTEELIRIKNEIDTRLNKMGNIDHALKDAELKLEKTKKELSIAARNLSSARHNVKDRLEEEINELLAFVGMKDSRFSIDMTETDHFTWRGTDRVGFLYTPASNIEFRELDRIASGGELSRLMLCIKSVLADVNDLPTLIFDEIDTGISGNVANKVAQVVKRISGKRQVIVITHLPQMAGKGDEQLLVYKEEGSKTINTKLRKLSMTERITEVARMLSGEEPSESAIDTAKDLIEA